LSAVEELAQRFDVPALTLEADTLLTVARQASISTQRRALAEASVNVIGKLAEADEYDRAIRLCEAAREAAQLSREYKLLNQLSTQLPELRRAQQELQRYRDALAVMEDAPTEPAANLAAGRYLCLIKGDWERGVPMLALGSDEPLKAVAVMELHGAETAEQQAAIGDAWWDLAEAKQAGERDMLRMRAGSWYQQAVPQLAGALAGLKVKQRLEEIGKLDRAIATVSRRLGSSTSPPLAIAPFDERTAKQHQAAWAKHLGVPVLQTNSIGMRFVLIPPGEFVTGSLNSEGAQTAERTQHRVRITKPFLFGVYEVTQADYQRVMGTNPSKAQGDPRRPVEQVSWNEAQDFCRRLSRDEGKVYRLPTEAEWEYACRAGTTTRYSFGDNEKLTDQYAWSSQNSGKKTQAVGRLRPNAFGLFDVHGNVWEWCADWHGERAYANFPLDDPTGPTTGSHRVYRGGGWYNSTGHAASASRGRYSSAMRSSIVGFRVVSSSVSASDG
jgi:formylglycine-generating enzyme required for sulfatase activity